MTETEFAAWLAEVVPAYAADKVTSGRWTEQESLERSRGEFEQLLPRGLGTDDHFLFTIVGPRGAAVGSLWYAKAARPGGDVAYVYDLVVKPEYRRQGHATRAFKALEREARARGLAGIALHVFGHNTAAQALYTKLGYLPTNINLYKPLRVAALR